MRFSGEEVLRAIKAYENTGLPTSFENIETYFGLNKSDEKEYNAGRLNIALQLVDLAKKGLVESVIAQLENENGRYAGFVLSPAGKNQLGI